MFGGLHLVGSPLGQPSIDDTARGGFWICEPVHVGVDSDTAALRARIRDASKFARLAEMLRLRS